MKEKQLRCSFCNKTQDQVAKLIAGPTVFICNECVDVCNDIIAGDPDSTPPASELESVNSARVPGDEIATRVLCALPTSVSDGLVIEDRGIQGILCNECEDTISAAIADRKSSDRRP